jgi:hypothetical protein
MLTRESGTCIREVLAFPGFLLRACLVALAFVILTSRAQADVQATTLVIENQDGVVVSGLNISTTSGPCIQIINSTNITIQQSQIGPCGQNGTANDSQGISIWNSSVNVYDSYIHVENLASVCGQSHDGILINNSNGPVVIQGNVIAYNERNIIVWGSSNVSAIGNFLLNPRGAASCGDRNNLGGPQFQAWADSSPNTNITVTNNYTVSALNGYLYAGNGSDQIGFGVTDNITVSNNWINGLQDNNGCGITLDYAANNATVAGNIVNETYHCGIGIASGVNHVVSGNRILITQGNSSAVGIGVTGGYPGTPCGPVTVSFNTAYAVTPNGWVQGYWDSGTCTRGGGVTLTGNTFDVGCSIPNCLAYSELTALLTTNPPPQIPPQPYSCVATSPYSTQSSMPLCSGGGPPAPFRSKR